jgi:hypothetical protein
VHTSAQDKTKRIWVSDILWENPASKYQPPTIFSRDFDITLHDDTAITDLKFSTNIEVTDPSSVITDQITLSTDEITAALTMDIYFEDFTSYRMTELIGILDDMTDAVIDN